MTASLAKIGYGTTVALGDAASPETMTTVAEVISVGAVGSTRELVEVTHLLSPNQTEENVAGIQKGETLSIKYNLTTANQAAIKTWYDNNVRTTVTITKPGTLSTRSFQGVPAAWHEGPFEVSGVIYGELQIKIAGAIT
jgi:hypothetical protein